MISDPPEQYAGFDANFKCSVIPTPPSDSEYSWNCSTGCFADMETEQTVNVSNLEVTDEGVLNCSVMIGDLEFFSDPYNLMLSGEEALDDRESNIQANISVFSSI